MSRRTNSCRSTIRCAISLSKTKPSSEVQSLYGEVSPPVVLRLKLLLFTRCATPESLISGGSSLKLRRDITSCLISLSSMKVNDWKRWNTPWTAPSWPPQVQEIWLWLTFFRNDLISSFLTCHYIRDALIWTFRSIYSILLLLANNQYIPILIKKLNINICSFVAYSPQMVNKVSWEKTKGRMWGEETGLLRKQASK